MKYFYMKVGKSNSLAEEWLAGKNPINQPAVVIFFGKSTIAEIKKHKQGSQTRDFYESSLPKNREHTLIVVIAHGKGWLLNPKGLIKEYKPTSKDITNKTDLWKIMPVKVLKSFDLKDVPPSLAGINANSYLVQGTYRKISNWGNIKAIHSVLRLPFPKEHLTGENLVASRLLECLSSVELETLVAKLFEANNCFVSAYRGGNIQDVDLFVHNDTTRNLNLDGLIVPANGVVTIQIKGWSRLRSLPDAVDYLVAFDAPNKPSCFDADWLLNQIRKNSRVNKWLQRSLNWLPTNFVSKYDL